MHSFSGSIFDLIRCLLPYVTGEMVQDKGPTLLHYRRSSSAEEYHAYTYYKISSWADQERRMS